MSTGNIKTSKKEFAYMQIKHSIMNNEFTSDTSLTEAFLCERFGFSRTPVREALQRLASEGFVTFYPEKGFFVAQLSLEDFLQIYEMREALEGMGARLCSMRITRSELQTLSHLLDKCIESYQKNDLKMAKEYDTEFHRFIIHSSKNSRIEATIKNLIELSKCSVVQSDDSLSSQDIDALQQLLNALRDSNESLAEELMRKRVAASKKYHFNRYYMGEYN